MFGGPIKRPEPIKNLKREQPRLSVGFGLQREKAASVILGAMLGGDLPLYVTMRPNAEEAGGPLLVPVDVLQRMPKVRGGLPDHPARNPASFLRNFDVPPDLLSALSASALHIRRTEFDAWYKRQKRRRLWPSQQESIKPRPGRPSKQTVKLLTSIRVAVEEKKWAAPDGIAKLARLMESNGAPLRNTLRRAVDRLYEETGDPAYHIIPRKRAKTKLARAAELVQNSLACPPRAGP
jgi:hypothetical protein